MKARLAILPGDGIGPEVMAQARRVLETVALRYGHTFSIDELPMGGKAIDARGTPLPYETLHACTDADAVLLGAVGGPRWDHMKGEQRPEAGLLALRKGMGVYANIRPAFLFPSLASACPLRPELVGSGFDFVIVRELTGGIYFGERGRSDDGTSAFDVERYSISEVTRLLKVAFGLASSRRRKLTVVDKANVLETSRLWRETARTMSREWPDVAVDFMYVDNCAMQLIRAPGNFDVIATSNMFGDILSDEASMLTGSIGMLPSASLGDGNGGLYEPIHGSAPDIAGTDTANPLAAILSASLLLHQSLGLTVEAAAVRKAVETVLESGLRTRDLVDATLAMETRTIGTAAMGDAVVRVLSTM